MNRLCVYCGSSSGANDRYATAAEELARLMVDADIGLVYGGASKGLMGVIADAVIDGGGEVHGVIPKALKDKEIAHDALTRLHVSLVGAPGLTRTDRVRFLKAYLTRFGSDARTWRPAWRALTAAGEKKLRARSVRRRWKLKHYGRE